MVGEMRNIRDSSDYVGNVRDLTGLAQGFDRGPYGQPARAHTNPVWGPYGICRVICSYHRLMLGNSVCHAHAWPEDNN